MIMSVELCFLSSTIHCITQKAKQYVAYLDENIITGRVLIYSRHDNRRIS
jgi:hypothetical protein